MFTYLRPALMLVILFTFLTGLALPLAMTGIAETVFPFQARGSLLMRDGKVIGSALIGQDFSADRYFHPRPSATTATDPKDPDKTVPSPYRADASNASNLGPTSQALIARVKADAASAGPAPVPADALTTSASGLDPDISPQFALRQAARVAAARGLAEDRVRDLVAQQTRGRLGGIVGEPRVNVLALNLALDGAQPR
jgi:K+-transporting ATPase ATPase C chain